MPNYIIYAVDWEIPDQIEEESLPDGVTDCYWLIPDPSAWQMEV